MDLFKHALPIREQYSKNVALWQSEIGEQNEVLHRWAYRDLKERADVPARSQEDPDWQGVHRADASAAGQPAIDDPHPRVNDIYDPSRHAKAQRFVDRRSASAGAGE
ncbi:MAG: NIPSNAP family protein [Candidatus Rokubacteria bacterium]|nr:NIPSNAP family protein [Candidatus Rokubacteria bacterium]